MRTSSLRAARTRLRRRCVSVASVATTVVTGSVVLDESVASCAIANAGTNAMAIPAGSKPTRIA